MSTKDVEVFLRGVKEGGFKVWRGGDIPLTPPPYTWTSMEFTCCRVIVVNIFGGFLNTPNSRPIQIIKNK